jgi:hypothetical protein
MGFTFNGRGCFRQVCVDSLTPSSGVVTRAGGRRGGTAQPTPAFGRMVATIVA